MADPETKMLVMSVLVPMGLFSVCCMIWRAFLSVPTLPHGRRIGRDDELT